MAGISFPALPPPSLPSLVPAILPAAGVPVGAVAPVAPLAPLALLQAELDALPLPMGGAQPAPLPAAAGDAPDNAAMRPDQAIMARQLTWPAPDGGALASSWRGMVRNYGTQLTARELRARDGQLPATLLLGSQGGFPPDAQAMRMLRQSDLLNPPMDAWRFTVHAGSAQDQHLRVVEDEPEQGRHGRRRGRAALRLELVLADGSVVTVQAQPVADGLLLELCAPGRAAMLRLHALQPELAAAIGRAGLRVLRWTYRDSLPEGRIHARLPSTEAATALSLPVFRAMAELALLLPTGAPRV